MTKTTTIDMTHEEAVRKLKLGIFFQGKQTYKIKYLIMWFTGLDDPIEFNAKEMEDLGKRSLTTLDELFNFNDPLLTKKLKKYELELVPSGEDNE